MRGQYFFPLIALILSILLSEIVSIKEDRHEVGALSGKGLDDFNFAAVGDWGCSTNAKSTVKNIIDKNPELVLGLGDYAYLNKPECWLKLIEPIDHKMKIAIGNHDHLLYTDGNRFHSSQTLLQQYTEHFNLTRQYYSFNYQNVHFLAMSTEISFGIGSNQYDFVNRDLEKAAADPKINWIVVYYHRVAYTSQVFPGPASNVDFRETYHPLFEKHNVDLVIQAHIHAYQRTYPIKYNTHDSFKPIITDNDTKNYNNPEGQIFTIVGTGGASVNYLQGPLRSYVASQFNAFGFLNLNVINSGTTLVGEFHENGGSIKDHFTITK